MISLKHSVICSSLASVLAVCSLQAQAALGAVEAPGAQNALPAEQLSSGTVSITGPDVSFSESAENTAAADQTAGQSADQELLLSLDHGADAAFTSAFAELMTRLSAGAYVPTAEEAASALTAAEIADGQLKLVFSNERINELLSSQGVAEWTGLNSPVIVWMADYALDSSTLVSGEHMSAFASALNTQAADYNLRLMYPLMDLDDVTQVNESTVLSHNDQQLAAASARYGADYILAAAVTPAAEMVTVNWNLLDKNGSAVGNASLQGPSDEVAQMMAGDLARTLANYHGTSAVQSNGQDAAGDAQTPVLAAADSVDPFALGPYQGLVRVRISGVECLKDLDDIKRTLIIYGYEDSVAVTAMEGSEVIMAVPSNGDPAILDGTMARARDFTKEGPWTYRFLKSGGAAAAAPEAGTLGPRSSRTAGSVSPVRPAPLQPALPEDPA